MIDKILDAHLTAYVNIQRQVSFKVCKYARDADNNYILDDDGKRTLLYAPVKINTTLDFSNMTLLEVFTAFIDTKASIRCQDIVRNLDDSEKIRDYFKDGSIDMKEIQGKPRAASTAKRDAQVISMNDDEFAAYLERIQAGRANKQDA